MRLAVIRCRNKSCDTVYEVGVDQERYIKCPVCSQNNEIDAISATLTGRCGKCGVPLDDHPRKECKP